MVKKKIEEEDCQEEAGMKLEIIAEKEADEVKVVDRSIQIHTLNTQVQVCSQDPLDDLDKLKKIAMSLVDKYK